MFENPNASNLPNPRYYPIVPSVEDIVTYAEDLDYEGHTITFEWAHGEMKNELLSFVRLGLIAQKVKRYKIYTRAKERFRTFREYCEKCLGKSVWHINRVIDAAKVTLALAQAGFTILPNCESQARPLVKFAGEDLIEKWQQVIDNIPKHRITASSVAAIVGDSEQKKQIRVSGVLYSKLALKAALVGLSVEELLEQLVDSSNLEEDLEPPVDDSIEVEEAGDRDEEDVSFGTPSKTKGQPFTTEKLATWLTDMQDLLVQHYGLEIINEVKMAALANSA
jgi:hypothetical protein